MSEWNGSLSPDRLRAVCVLAGAKSDGAETAGCEPEAVAGWLDREPEFMAGLNRAVRGTLPRWLGSWDQPASEPSGVTQERSGPSGDAIGSRPASVRRRASEPCWNGS